MARCLCIVVHGTPEGCSEWRSTGVFDERCWWMARAQREVAREFGISRKTIQKMLRYAVPPGYQRQQAVKRPKLGPWVGVIDAMQEEDQRRPAKQRHTRQADLRTAQGRAWVHGRLHDREGLCAYGDAARPGDVRCR